jgi:hypothetical protein
MKLKISQLSILTLAVVVGVLGVRHLLMVEVEINTTEKTDKVSRKVVLPSISKPPKEAKVTTPVRPKYQQLVSSPKKVYRPTVISSEKREALRDTSPRISALWKNEKGEEPTYREKNEAINHLGVNLQKEEREAIYDYFRSGPSDDVYDLAVMDRLMIHLDNIPSIAPEYVSEMTNIVKDESVKGSVRGYVMQHLGDSYDTRPALRGQLQNVYYEGLKDSSTDVSGTSVMVLTDLSRKYDHFDKGALGKATIELTESEETWHASRISAMSAVGRLGQKEALPTVRQQVKEGDGIVMKLSAIHSLGQLGEEKDIKVLEEILKDPNKKVYAVAAKKALDSIQQRF